MAKLSIGGGCAHEYLAVEVGGVAGGGAGGGGGGGGPPPPPPPPRSTSSTVVRLSGKNVGPTLSGVSGASELRNGPLFRNADFLGSSRGMGPCGQQRGCVSIYSTYIQEPGASANVDKWKKKNSTYAATL